LADICFELKAVWACSIEEMQKVMRRRRKWRQNYLTHETTHSKLWNITG
jgi:hypothetical protein